MADKRDGQSVQGTPTPSPPPCAKGCGFFGSPSTLNMCSKCFRDHQKRQAADETSAASVSPAASTNAQPSSSQSTEVRMTPPAAPQPVGQHLAAAETPSMEIVEDVVAKKDFATASVKTKADEEDGPPPRKVQKNTSRCFSCNKKIGLTGFQCRCGYFFCGIHRYSDQHGCDFDYQASAREQLEKANPVVVASKLHRI